MGFVYDPQAQLRQLFPDASALENIDHVIEYIGTHKAATNAKISALAASYQHPIDIGSDIHTMASSLQQVRQHANDTQDRVSAVTAEIQKLDITKQNLVLSMKVLKRLQMLMNAFDSLQEVVPTHDYQQIASYLGAVKGLLEFFKDYKSIDEIAALHQRVHSIQNKLVDDVFIDFEDSFTNHFTNDKLRYGCDILELAGPKYKDKLLTWFYNLQLKEISAIFNSGEAGSIENLNRRYLFFNNVLDNIQTNFLSVFPQHWQVDLELSKLFCKITGQDIPARLSDNNVSPTEILDALTNTLSFERKLNDKFGTSEFSKVISGVFEPHLTTWVREQESSIATRFGELYSRPKIPAEIASAGTCKDLLAVLRVNSVPNFADSSVELFKAFQRSLSQTVKISSGELLVQLSSTFAKFIRDYHNNILLPVYNSSLEHPEGIESIKYLTMIFNTADYVIQNTIDLEDRFYKVTDVAFRDQVHFDYEKNMFFEIISKSIGALVSKVSADLSFSWRLFENNAWDSLEAVTDTSNYMGEFILSLKENHSIICPLIIRESYVRNYVDRLVERIIVDFMNKLSAIQPLSITAIEQLLLDASSLKSFFKGIFEFCDPNFSGESNSEAGSATEPHAPKAYLRRLNSQFSKLEILLKLLLTPTLPVENIVESYVGMIGDKSEVNLRKVLALKGINPSDQSRYVENFKLTILSRDLPEESSILSSLGETQVQAGHPSSQTPANPVTFKDVVSRSPEPHIPDFLKNNKFQAMKFNNAFRDLSINGENQVNKFNENFKNFGKFFRKDD